MLFYKSDSEIKPYSHARLSPMEEKTALCGCWFCLLALSLLKVLKEPHAFSESAAAVTSSPLPIPGGVCSSRGVRQRLFLSPGGACLSRGVRRCLFPSLGRGVLLTWFPSAPLLSPEERARHMVSIGASSHPRGGVCPSRGVRQRLFPYLGRGVFVTRSPSALLPIPSRGVLITWPVSTSSRSRREVLVSKAGTRASAFGVGPLHAAIGRSDGKDPDRLPYHRTDGPVWMHTRHCPDTGRSYHPPVILLLVSEWPRGANH